MNRPLAGRRIVVTRARHQAERLANALRDLGAEVIELPVIEIVPPATYAPLDAALQNINLYQWLIFTSANAVRVLSERLAVLGLEATSFANCKVIAVGPATVAALESNGISVDRVPESYVAEGVIDLLSTDASGVRALLIRAKVARDAIPDTLRRHGAVVDIIDAYETVMPAGSLAMLPVVLASKPDAITFTSSSTVKNFFALLTECGREFPLDLRAISIGPITSQSLRECNWEPFAEASRFDVSGLIDATVRALC